MKPSSIRLCLLIPFLAAGLSASAEKPDENLFGTIRVDGKKIGTAHYTVSYDEEGSIDELRSNASYSVLGIQLYHFAQDVVERWTGGELQSFFSSTNDDGKRYSGELTRESDRYEAVLNGEARRLPHDACPASVWHFRITEKRLLFSLTDFQLMKVEVSERPERIRIGGRPVDTRRFDFEGDWHATLWFDRDDRVLQFRYPVEGRQVLVTLDP